MTALGLSPEEFKRVADRLVQLATDYLASLDQRAIFPVTSGTKTQELFGGSAPEQGSGPAALDALEHVLHHSRAQNGRFFGYVLGSAEPVAAAATLLASVINQNVTAWRSAPSAVTLEQTVIRWLAEGIGCAGFSGSLAGGGSAANLMALAMAREIKAPANQAGAQEGTVYASEEVHMSIPKAIALLGIGRDNLRLLPVDEEFKLRPDSLARVMEEDRRHGKPAIAIVASAGTVNTGAIDPLGEIAAVAREYGAWFHVDGAYGALAALAAPEKFRGMEQADSISLDPHKWLYQPLDCGCLLYREPEAVRKTFSHTGVYARSLSDDPVEGFAFFEESLELSRPFRALKLWLSLRYHGLGAFRQAIENDLRHAQLLAEGITSHQCLELLAPVELSAVCFRYRDSGRNEEELNRLNSAILQRILSRGRVYLSNASLRARFALRACIVNHRTTDEDVVAVVEEVIAAAEELCPA